MEKQERTYRTWQMLVWNQQENGRPTENHFRKDQSTGINKSSDHISIMVGCEKLEDMTIIYIAQFQWELITDYEFTTKDGSCQLSMSYNTWVFSKGRWPNFTKFGENIVLSSLHTKFERFHIFFCFETRAAQSQVRWSDRCQKSYFLTLRKIRGETSKIFPGNKYSIWRIVSWPTCDGRLQRILAERSSVKNL